MNIEYLRKHTNSRILQHWELLRHFQLGNNITLQHLQLQLEIYFLLDIFIISMTGTFAFEHEIFGNLDST